MLVSCSAGKVSWERMELYRCMSTLTRWKKNFNDCQTGRPSIRSIIIIIIIMSHLFIYSWWRVLGQLLCRFLGTSRSSGTKC